MNINLTTLIDDAKCYRIVRQTRWGDGVCCPRCQSQEVIKRGKHDTQAHRQRYQCKGCSFNFDDLTDTIFAGHHQSLHKWIGCLYLMGLNLSSEQIAQELNLDKDDVYQMTMQLRQGIVDNKPEMQLAEEVECDEVYITAGHKGQPEVVRKRGDLDALATDSFRADILSEKILVSKGFGVVARSKRRNRRSSG